MATLDMASVPSHTLLVVSSTATARRPASELAHNRVRGPLAYPRAAAWQASIANSGPEAAPMSPQQSAGESYATGSSKYCDSRKQTKPHSSPRYRSPLMSQITALIFPDPGDGVPTALC